jgi:glycosyltransferase involved in cell wall biosynthesis
VNILYLTLDPPLDPARIATGNQVRAQGISEALSAAGHEVMLAVPEGEHPAAANETCRVYRSREDLQQLLAQAGIEVVLVGYWSLLAHLPATRLPIVLDVIAPRLLELLYQGPEQLPERARELIALLPRADHFLVGNQRQADLLLGQLLQAGFDCRVQAPISILPIAARGKVQTATTRNAIPRIVDAGVSWPWRQNAAYTETLRELAARRAVELVELRGAYPGSATLAKGHTTGMASGLRSYQGMQQALLECDAGMELGEDNTERRFSHSFRALEYLECGLPVIINSWIPLASLVEQYDAGWVIDSPQELAALVQHWQDEPGALAAKRRGALALRDSQLNYAHAVKPLLAWLQNPHKATRFGTLPSTTAGSGETPKLQAFIPEPAAAPSSLKVLAGSLFKIVLCPPRADSNPDVLMMTRADLFPTDHGAAVKIIRTAEALSRQGRDVYLATDDRNEYFRFHQGQRSTHRFPLWLRLLRLPRVMAFSRLILKGYPVSNSFLYLPVTDGSYILRALWLTSRKPVGAYIAEFPAYVRPLRFARSLFGGKLMLVQHNVEYERIRNQVKDLSAKNFAALKQLEMAMCQLADSIVTVSDNDRDKLVEDGIDAHKIHTIPHGVDLQAFHSATPMDIRQHYDLPAKDAVLVYHGTYSYPPNLEAMQVMAQELLPRLEALGVSVTVLAIGSKPPDFPVHEKIRFVGSVIELADVLPAADLAVVPLMDGGGTRMKILDYFAAGVPVISTAKGIEGIPVHPGREALVIDDFDAMSEAIARLLSDGEAAQRLAANATAFVESLSWDAIARRYLPLMK